MVVCLERGADCIWPSWCHCHSLSLASVKSRLVLPFWYRLTRVVPEKGSLNVCVRWPQVSWIWPVGLFPEKSHINKNSDIRYGWKWFLHRNLQYLFWWRIWQGIHSRQNLSLPAASKVASKTATWPVVLNLFATPPLMGKRSIVISMSVCLSVCMCLSVCDHIFGTTRLTFTKFLCMLPMAVARSSSDGIVVRYVLPVLWMTS